MEHLVLCTFYCYDREHNVTLFHYVQCLLLQNDLASLSYPFANDVTATLTFSIELNLARYFLFNSLSLQLVFNGILLCLFLNPEAFTFIGVYPV